jgi:glyoxylase-like metal-dependent hydrolase (beta-lactamase superfamily II)
MRALPAGALTILLGAGAASSEDLFELKKVTEGVWAAVARPLPVINCNAAVIVLEDGVMVVDSHSRPSAARALMAQIRTLTDKPVKWVVNTHFHWDHYQGNQAYVGAWPSGTEIIASHATREAIESRGIPRVKHEIATVPLQLERLRSERARATADPDRQRLDDEIRARDAYLAELRAMQVTLPGLTFEKSLMLHRGARSVHVLWLGKAHTDGDVVVYLPQDKVIATGDLLHGWMPYMADSYPYDWIRTLEAAAALDFDAVIPGHGDVMRGKDRFRLWTRYFRDLLREAGEAYARGDTLAEAREKVAAALRPTYGPAFGARFDDGVGGNINKAYRVVGGVVE